MDVAVSTVTSRRPEIFQARARRPCPAPCGYNRHREGYGDHQAGVDFERTMQVALKPFELPATRLRAAGLEIDHVDEPMKCTPPASNEYSPAPCAPFAVALLVELEPSSRSRARRDKCT